MEGDPSSDAMVTDDIRYAKNGDIHIAYDLMGEGGGTDVVLIRTYVSQLEHFRRLPRMAAFTERLGRLGRLICFDHRGTGLSDRLRGYRLPTIEERVDDLRAVLDAVGSERALLVALADGGPLGCMFAASHPERTRGAGPLQHETPDRLGSRLPVGHARRPSSSASWRTSTATGGRVRWPRPTLGVLPSRA